MPRRSGENTGFGGRKHIHPIVRSAGDVGAEMWLLPSWNITHISSVMFPMAITFKKDGDRKIMAFFSLLKINGKITLQLKQGIQ